ncbi:hypothetical protein MMC10_005294 [Thelotrema lepadinum]|nr:hypothetical protein [Thelotrema lepadinum]
MKIPDGFIGIVTTGHNSGGGKKGISQNNLKIGGTPEEEEDEVAESIEGEATFNSIVVWDHEMQPQGKDQFFRGIEEWLAFAEKLHNVDAPIPNAR